ncbi:MBL fold metallo-hydrolase [Halalkalibacterium halodurans]|uniref:MBL fold metallo-hydrolase n=1 Tax=Halalkalibacterium halodurans TaxID=86665 RepID=UPI00106878F6|nr:MBL fold metallo-hydrolase [Halalkalibacterium halodurans]TES45944.1 MBL fold metallo-hydrolase [Halalkalibacterium halodurans]
MKRIQVSPHIYKLESWFLLKMSAWIVKEDEGVYIVDTGMPYMGKRILKEAEKLGKVKGVLLTHGHSDHVGGLKKILDIQDLPVYVHTLDIKHMEGKEPFPGRKKREYLVEPGVAKPLPVDEDGEFRCFGNLVPYHTPGHSPGHVCYYHKKDRVLLGGDLFTSKRGKLQQPIKMFTADMNEAVRSGEIVKKLQPSKVSICHGNDIDNPHTQINEYLTHYKYERNDQQKIKNEDRTIS